MKRILSSVSLALICLMMISSFVFAVSWAHKFPTTVKDTGGTSRDYYPVYLGYGASSLISSGTIAANGLNTNMQIGSDSIKYMIDTTKVMAVVPSLPANGSQTVDLYTGYSPAQTNFSIITGDGGYVTTLDDAAIELGGNFSITIDGYFNTAATYVNANILYKQDAIRVYVQAAGVVRAAILTTGDTEVKSVDAAVASGDHTIVVAADGVSLTISVGGVVADTEFISYVDDVVSGSTIASSLNTTSTADFRTGFYYNSLMWAFYYQTDGVYFKTSADGSTWSGATQMRAYVGTNSDFSIFFDGTYGHYAVLDGTTIYYRRFTPNGDGTVTYSAVEQTVWDNGNGLSTPIIGVSNTGYPWISAVYNAGLGYTSPRVTKSSTNDGTWSTAGGFPYQLMSNVVTTTEAWSIVPITGNNMMILYRNTAGVFARYYNGSMQAETTVYSYSNSNPSEASATSDGTAVFAVTDLNSGYFNYWTSGSGWSTAQAFSIAGQYTISYDSTSDIVYVYQKTSGNLKYKRFNPNTFTWIDGTWQALVSDASLSLSEYGLHSYIISYSGYVGISYVRHTSGDMISVIHTTTYEPVPDTVNDYVLFDDNSMPYTDSFNLDVNGVEIIEYMPPSTVQDTTLADNTGAAQNGTITWGANTDITNTPGTPENPPGSVVIPTTTPVPFDPGPAPLPANWFGGCTNVTNLPVYDAFLQVANQTGQSVCDLYFLAFIGFAFGALLLLVVFTRSALLGAAAFNIVLYIGSTTTVVPMWIPFACTIVMIAIIFLYKQVAY